MDNLKKMDKFLEMYNFPRQNQEETENMNELITSNEVESVIKTIPPNKSPGTCLAVQWLRLCAPNAGNRSSSPGQGTKIPLAAQCNQKKSSRPYGFTGEFYQTLTRILKLFQKTAEKENTNLLYEACIILIQKPDKDNTQKKNYRPISLVNIDTKTLNKLTAN